MGTQFSMVLMMPLTALVILVSAARIPAASRALVPVNGLAVQVTIRQATAGGGGQYTNRPVRKTGMAPIWYGAAVSTARDSAKRERAILFLLGALLLGVATSLRVKVIRSAEKRETTLGFSQNANH